MLKGTRSSFLAQPPPRQLLATHCSTQWFWDKSSAIPTESSQPRADRPPSIHPDFRMRWPERAARCRAVPGVPWADSSHCRRHPHRPRPHQIRLALAESTPARQRHLSCSVSVPNRMHREQRHESDQDDRPGCPVDGDPISRAWRSHRIRVPIDDRVLCSRG